MASKDLSQPVREIDRIWNRNYYQTSNQMALTPGTFAAIVGVLVLFIIGIAIYTSKHAVRQHFAPEFSGLGPMNAGFGYIPLYTNIPGSTTAGSGDDATSLLKWWFKYADDMGPEVAGAAYAMCEDLETATAIESYGLTAPALITMKRLRAVLKDVPASSIKTNVDVQKRFGPTCMNMANNRAGWVSKDALYNDLPSAAKAPGAHVIDVY